MKNVLGIALLIMVILVLVLGLAGVFHPPEPPEDELLSPVTVVVVDVNA